MKLTARVSDIYECEARVILYIWVCNGIQINATVCMCIVYMYAIAGAY